MRITERIADIYGTAKNLMTQSVFPVMYINEFCGISRLAIHIHELSAFMSSKFPTSRFI